MFDVGGKGVGGEGGTYAVGATIGRLCHHITGVVNDKDVVASGTGHGVGSDAADAVEARARCGAAQKAAMRSSSSALKKKEKTHEKI
jgi:hypothetical protein